MHTHTMIAKFAVAATVVAAALAIGAQSTGRADARSGASAKAGVDASAPATIVKTLQDAKQFKILCELLTTANLIDRLNGAGPFTVFAPTDGAFGNLPPETLASLKKDPAALAEILNTAGQRRISPDVIIREVAAHYGVELRALQGRSRSQSVVLPRQVAMYLLREETGLSLVDIGQLLGGRDHTTVIHGFDKVTEELNSDARLRRDVATIRERLYQGPDGSAR